MVLSTENGQKATTLLDKNTHFACFNISVDVMSSGLIGMFGGLGIRLFPTIVGDSSIILELQSLRPVASEVFNGLTSHICGQFPLHAWLIGKLLESRSCNNACSAVLNGGQELF